MRLPPDQYPLSDDPGPAEGTDPAGTEGEADMARLSGATPRWLHQLRGWRQAPEWLLKLVEQDKDALSAIDLGVPLAETSPERPVDVGQAVPEQAVVPDWLQDLRPGAEQATPPGQEAEATVVQPPEEPVPAWLSGLERALDRGAEEEPSAVSPEGEEAPDWLSALRREPEGQAEEGPPTAFPEEQEVPDWLSAPRQELEGQAEEGPPAIFPEEQEVPDWLSRLGEEPGGTPEEELSAVSPEQEVADWLSRLEQTPAEQQAAPAFGEAELPDWLARPSQEPEPGFEEEPSVALAEGGQGTEVQPGPEEVMPSRAEQEPAAFADAELPGWLREFDQASALRGIAGEHAALADTETSGWLSDLEQGPEEPVAEEPAAGLVDESGIPGQPESIEAPSAAPPLPFAAPPLPFAAPPLPFAAPTLEQVPGEAPAEAEVPATAEVGAQSPEWPGGVEDTLAAPTEAVSHAAPVEEVGLPDWLQGLEVPSAGQPTPRRSVTDWLRSVEETPAAVARPPQPAVEPEPEPEPTAPAELVAPAPEEAVEAPQWLQESISAEESAWTQESPLEGQPMAPSSWLTEPGLVEEKAEAEILPGLPEGAALPADEIPSWLEELRSQEASGEPERAAEAQAVETSGPLVGLTGLLNPEPLLGIFPKSTYKPMAPVPEAHLAEARLLEQILAEPTARPGAVSRKPGREVMRSLGRWVMYVALLAAMIAAAFVPELQGLVQTPDIPEAKDLYAVIGSLPAQSQVLLALDYDASLDGELTPQARVILWHALRQGLGVVTVSMTPQGAAIAQGLYESDAADISSGGRYVWGESFINLGYLPPHPASLQAFMSNPLGGALFGGTAASLRPGQGEASSLLQMPLAQRIRSFDDLDLVIVISGNQDHVRWWIEQVGSQHPVRIVAGVSAAIAPYLQPYYSEGERGQLKGMLPGLAGAAAYEVLAQARFSPSARENLILQGYAQVVLVIVILLGGIRAVFGISRGK